MALAGGEVAVVVVADYVQGRHLLYAVVQHVQVLEQEGGVGALLVGLQVG